MIKLYQIDGKTIQDLIENGDPKLIPKLLLGMYTPSDSEFESLYTKVWEGDIGTYGLEEIFHKFNEDRPKDFFYKSMSSGDIVELPHGKYLCKFSGWEKLSY